MLTAESAQFARKFLSCLDTDTVIRCMFLAGISITWLPSLSGHGIHGRTELWLGGFAFFFIEKKGKKNFKSHFPYNKKRFFMFCFSLQWLFSILVSYFFFIKSVHSWNNIPSESSLELKGSYSAFELNTVKR